MLKKIQINKLLTVLQEITQLSGNKSLTTDCWRSFNNDSYIVETAHFLNENFQLMSALLEHIAISGSHTNGYLAEMILNIFKKCMIQYKITLAVSGNIENAITKVLGWKYFGCLAHTIHLLVSVTLNTPEM